MNPLLCLNDISNKDRIYIFGDAIFGSADRYLVRHHIAGDNYSYEDAPVPLTWVVCGITGAS